VRLLVTGDHETGGFSIISQNLATTLPNSTDTIEELRGKREARANEITVAWSTTGHTSTQVYLNGLGPNAENILEAEHHIDTFSIMRYVIDGKTDPDGKHHTLGAISDFWIYTGGIILISGTATIIVSGIMKLKRRRN